MSIWQLVSKLCWKNENFPLCLLLLPTWVSKYKATMISSTSFMYAINKRLETCFVHCNVCGFTAFYLNQRSWVSSFTFTRFIIKSITFSTARRQLIMSGLFLCQPSESSNRPACHINYCFLACMCWKMPILALFGVQRIFVKTDFV